MGAIARRGSHSPPCAIPAGSRATARAGYGHRRRPDEPVSTYAFVADPNAGTTLARGANPALTYTLDWGAMAAVPHVDGVLDKMSGGSGSWIGYSVITPVTGEVEDKRAWPMMHDGLVFGSGCYSSY